MKTLRIDGKDYQVEDEVSDFCLQTSNRATEMQTALGVDSHEKALATVAGLKEKASKVDELAAAVQLATEEKRAAAVKAMLDTATTSGQLTPAKRKEIESGENAVLAGFAKDPEQLKAFLDCLPVLPVAKTAAAPAPVTSDPTDPTQGGKRGFADLSNMEKADLYLANRPLYDELKAKAGK